MSEFILSPAAKQTCERCPLAGSRFVNHQVTTEVHRKPTTDGSMGVEVLFIAEAPGKVENQRGRPAIGGSGLILRRLVYKINGGDEGVAYGSIVRCRPANVDDPRKDRPPSPRERSACRSNILDDIARIKPKRIVLLGRSAAVSLALHAGTLQAVDPESSIFKLRGKDYVIQTPDGVQYPTTVTYHFAFIARSPTHAGVFEEDIAKMFYRADGVLPDYSPRGKPVNIITDLGKLNRLLKHMVVGLDKEQIVAMDYETVTNTRISNPVLTIGFAFDANQAHVIPYHHPESPWSGPEFREVERLMKKFFTTRHVSFRSLVCHNVKFECALTLDAFGVSLWNLPLEDTMLRAHSINENRKAALGGAFGLKALSDEWLGFQGYYADDIAPIVALRNKGMLREAPIKPLCEYNGMDCYVTWRLHQCQELWARQDGYDQKLRRLGLLLHGPESMFAARMERNGIRADKKSLRLLMRKDSPIVGRQSAISAELTSMSSVQEANKLLLRGNVRTRGLSGIWGKGTQDPWLFHINKPDSKKALFSDVLQLSAKKTKHGKLSFGKGFYGDHKGIPEVELISEWTALDKLRSTYVDSIFKMLQMNPDMRDGRVRASFNFHRTATSRTSSDQPNMQNIPKGKTPTALAVKSVFSVDPGNLMICADYSQAEVRWLAQITGDPFLKSAFEAVAAVQKAYRENPTPENFTRLMQEGDFHRQTAAIILMKPAQDITEDERGKAKCVHPQTLVYSGALLHIKNVAPFGKEDAFTQSSERPLHVNGKQWTSLEATYNGGTKPLLHVVARRGVLTCSGAHRFKLANGKLKRADKLKRGDALMEIEAPEVLPTQQFLPIDITLSYDLPPLKYHPSLETAYFAGLFVGDGIKMSEYSVAFTHGDVNKTDSLGVPYSEWQASLIETCESLGLSSTTPHDTTLCFGSRHVVKWLQALELVDTTGKTLSIPQWVLSAGRRALLSFLGGLFDTDGTVYANGTLAVTTKSAVLAGQIAAVLHYLGLHPSMDPGWSKTYKRWYYRVRLPVGEAGHFKKWVRHQGKKKRLRPLSKVRHLSKNIVLQVIPAGTAPCVDVTVKATDHLYATNGVVTHNSVVFGLIYGMSVFGLAERLKITKEEAEEFQETFLNQFPKAREWLSYIEEEGFAAGHVESPIGRRRHLSSGFLVDDNNQFFEFDGLQGTMRRPTEIGKRKSYEDRVSRNAPIQSIASDTNLMACINIQHYIEEHNKSWRLINIVHDSIIAEVPWEDARAYIEVVNRIMTDPELFRAFNVEMTIPFVADFTLGPNWGIQVDVGIDEKYGVICKACGEERKETAWPTNKRCESCGSDDVSVELRKGPLDLVLRYVNHRYQYEAR